MLANRGSLASPGCLYQCQVWKKTTCLKKKAHLQNMKKNILCASEKVLVLLKVNCLSKPFCSQKMPFLEIAASSVAAFSVSAPPQFSCRGWVDWCTICTILTATFYDFPLFCPSLISTQCFYSSYNTNVVQPALYLINRFQMQPYPTAEL